MSTSNFVTAHFTHNKLLLHTKTRTRLRYAFRKSALTFSTLEDEWHAVPAFVANVEARHGERWRYRVLRHGLVVEVAELLVALTVLVTHVLAENDIVKREGLDALEHFNLYKGNVECLESAAVVAVEVARAAWQRKHS